jgi:hypothetical protein
MTNTRLIYLIWFIFKVLVAIGFIVALAWFTLRDHAPVEILAEHQSFSVSSSNDVTFGYTITRQALLRVEVIEQYDQSIEPDTANDLEFNIANNGRVIYNSGAYAGMVAGETTVIPYDILIRITNRNQSKSKSGFINIKAYYK